MKHLAGMVLALLAFAVATVLLIYNVKELAHAPLLLGAIVGFYLLAFAARSPCELAAARPSSPPGIRRIRPDPAEAPRDARRPPRRERGPRLRLQLRADVGDVRACSAITAMDSRSATCGAGPRIRTISRRRKSRRF
jgi:hypothetical protein